MRSGPRIHSTMRPPVRLGERDACRAAVMRSHCSAYRADPSTAGIAGQEFSRPTLRPNSPPKGIEALAPKGLAVSSHDVVEPGSSEPSSHGGINELSGAPCDYAEEPANSYLLERNEWFNGWDPASSQRVVQLQAGWASVSLSLRCRRRRHHRTESQSRWPCLCLPRTSSSLRR